MKRWSLCSLPSTWPGLGDCLDEYSVAEVMLYNFWIQVRNGYASSTSFSWHTNCWSLSHHEESLAAPRLPYGEPTWSDDIWRERNSPSSSIPQMSATFQLRYYEGESFRGDWVLVMIWLQLEGTLSKNHLTRPFQNQDSLSK